MAVRLTSPVLGKDVGETYTGPLETWLLNEGYATVAAEVPDAWEPDSDGILGGDKLAVTLTPTAAVLNGANNAVNQTANGQVIFGTKGGKRTVVTLASGDTPAQAATKIDTALDGKADAAIVSNKLRVTSVATGPKAYVVVVDGTSAVLTALGVALGQSAHGGTGQPLGAADNPTAAPEADDPTVAANREKPYWPTTPDRNSTMANDADNLNEEKFPAPGFDFDPDGEDDDAPSNVTLDPVEGPEAGGTVVTLVGDNLVGVTAVNFGATPGTAFDDDEAAEGSLKVTSPAGEGVVDVTLVDAAGNLVLEDAFTYTE